LGVKKILSNVRVNKIKSKKEEGLFCARPTDHRVGGKKEFRKRERLTFVVNQGGEEEEKSVPGDHGGARRGREEKPSTRTRKKERKSLG